MINQLLLNMKGIGPISNADEVEEWKQIAAAQNILAPWGHPSGRRLSADHLWETQRLGAFR